MRAHELRSLAAVLANKCFVRYWLHWNYPQREPWLMAVAGINHDGTDADFYTPDLRDPLRVEARGGIKYYIYERVDAPER